MSTEKHSQPPFFCCAREYFLNRPPVTILYFEDGEAIPFVGVLDDVEIGVKYRIIYHERYVYAGNVHWTDYYHEVGMHACITPSTVTLDIPTFQSSSVGKGRAVFVT